MKQRFPFPCAADFVASVGAEGDVSAGALAYAVLEVSRALQKVPKGSEVLVVCEDRTDLAVCLLGCWQAGVAAALPPNQQHGTLAELCKGDRIRALVGRDLPTLLERRLLRIELPSAPPHEIAAREGNARLEDIDAERHLVTVYTSGTIGRHQRHEKTAAQLLGEAEMLCEHFSMTPERSVLATVASHHIYGLLFGLLVPLLARARFIGVLPLHIEAISAALTRYAVTDLVSVPAHLQGLAELPKGALGPVRRIFSSAAPLYPSTAALLRTVHDVEVVEVLGSTETGGIAWRNQEGPWLPLPGVRVGAFGDGTIEVHSPFLAASDGPIFRGQDRIELVPGGGFRHLGRDDGVVKVAGKRVALQEIEASVRQLPGVRDVAAIVLEANGLRGAEIGLVVAGSGWHAATLKEALLEWFDAVVLPRRYRFVEALPREQNGKLRRAELLALFAQSGGQMPNDEGRIREGMSEKQLEITTRVLEIDRSQGRLSVEVHVPKGLRFFEGHFPGQPILPGVAQLCEIVLPLIEAHWPNLGPLSAIKRLKFKELIVPGDDLVLVITVGEADTMRFSLARGEAECCLGILEFGRALE